MTERDETADNRAVLDQRIRDDVPREDVRDWSAEESERWRPILDRLAWPKGKGRGERFTVDVRCSPEHP